MFASIFTAKSTRLVGTAVAAFVAASVLATSFATSANAGSRERAFAGGLAAGIIGTAIIASERRRYREDRYYRASRWERHVDRCYRRYRSYDEATDTWIDRRGRVRRCRL